MARPIVVGALLFVLGALSAAVVFSSRAPTEPRPAPHRLASTPLASARGFGAVAERAEGSRSVADLQQRVKVLEARLAEEALERERLQTRFDAVSAELAALRGNAGQPAGPPADASAPPAEAGAANNAAADAPAIDYSKSAMERALMSAGVDPGTAADIKRRHDALAMSEMYLRDQATREEWLDTPRFDQELAAIQAQQRSVRDEIGDEAYDRYLFALGQTNRVRVDDVMVGSPAALAGLQTGDMIVRYGDTRVFGPDELVAQTRIGNAGDTVRLEVIRNGERLEVEVPRGPLGLRIAATQDAPQNG